MLGGNFMRNRKFSILVISAILLLSACSGQPAENSPSATGSPEFTTGSSQAGSSRQTTSPSSFVTGTPDGPARNVPFPPISDQASKFSEDGAEAFTLHYFDLINYVIDTSDTEAIKKLTENDCTVCYKQIINEADKAKKDHKWQVGGKHHPKVVDSYISGKNIAIVTVEYTSDVGTVYSAPHKVHEKIALQTDARIAFDLSFDRGWTVHQIKSAS